MGTRFKFTEVWASEVQISQRLRSNVNKCFFLLHFFKRTVHSGNSTDKRLLLDLRHLLMRSVVSAFVCTLPVLKKSTGKARLNRQALIFKNHEDAQFT